MQFLNLALDWAYIAKPELGPILVLRMVQISIAHGTCRISANAFGCYGAWLMNSKNSDYEKGYRMGKVALSLVSNLGAKKVSLSRTRNVPVALLRISFLTYLSYFYFLLFAQYFANVYSVVYGLINVWKEPFQGVFSLNPCHFSACTPYWLYRISCSDHLVLLCVDSIS